MARDGYRRRTVDPALSAAPAVLFTLGRINCRQLSAHKPEGSCGRGSLYSACYPRCWVRAVSGGACHGLRWPFRLSSSRHAPGRAGDRLRRAPNRYDTETKVRSTRWTMSGSSASAIAITTRIPGNGIFRRRKNMRHSRPAGLRLARFRLQARRPIDSHQFTPGGTGFQNRSPFLI